MLDCPCGCGRSISPEQPTCPACGTDLAPLYRLKTLGEQILGERKHFIEEKQRQEKRISLLKKGLLILPAVTLAIGFYCGSALRGPVPVQQPSPAQTLPAASPSLSPSAPPSPSAPVPAPAPAPSGSGRAETVNFIYTVKKGDTLSKTAFRFYGNSSQWGRIYEANRDILSDPNVISEGMEIIIPFDRK